MMCALAWNNRRRLLAVRLFFRSFAQAGMFSCVPLPPATAVRPPHRTQNEACCVWKTAAVKQPSVRSLPFITERFISAVKKPLRFEPLVRASPYSSIFCLNKDWPYIVQTYVSVYTRTYVRSHTYTQVYDDNTFRYIEICPYLSISKGKSRREGENKGEFKGNGRGHRGRRHWKHRRGSRNTALSMLKLGARLGMDG